MKLIKYIKITVVASVLALGYIACDEIGPGALEKPASTDVTIDTMFSNAEYAERVVWRAYRSLRSSILQGSEARGIGQALPSDITDLSHNFMTWTGAVTTWYPGALNSSNCATDNVQLPFVDITNRGIYTFQAMRNCYVFLANVDRVPDMSENDKLRLSAEARCIIAYNMTELFRNYGGIPYVRKVYSPSEDFTNPRMTVEATVDSIVEIIDLAIPDLPFKVSEEEMSNWEGRFTQAGAMALKTRLLLYAASPLFNSTEPYMPGEAADLKLTWYGDYQASRYQRAADAAKELIDLVDASDAYGLVMPETQNVKGYRDAYYEAYSSRQSSEILISVRDGYNGPPRWGSQMFDINLNYGGGTCTDEFMRSFPMADGTPIDDPASGWDENVDPLGSEGKGDARKYNRDPRLYETMQCVDDDWSGQTVENWKNQVSGKWALHVAGPRRTNGSGSTVIRKFIPGWNTGAGRPQIQFPYIRLPEIYLSYAEALNELGRQDEAYPYINKVRNRVGLKNIEEVRTWNKESLREQILTERICEFGFENVRWFDILRHKLSSALTKPLHNVWIEKTDNGFTYKYDEISVNRRAMWVSWDNKWFLLPFPLDELQKDYGLIQNPGW